MTCNQIISACLGLAERLLLLYGYVDIITLQSLGPLLMARTRKL